MEEVLEVYQRPYDPRRPMVCMDELPQQLLVNVREPLPMEPGCPLREDYEYERKGVSNLFLFFEPLAGKRHVQVSERRTKVDWAHAMRHLADELYPEADVIVVVMDNLNTHSPASFSEAFEPAEAQRLRARFEFHSTRQVARVSHPGASTRARCLCSQEKCEHIPVDVRPAA